MSDEISDDTTVTIRFKEEAEKSVEVTVARLAEVSHVSKLDLTSVTDIDKLSVWIDKNFSQIHMELNDEATYEDENAEFDEAYVTE